MSDDRSEERPEISEPRRSHRLRWLFILLLVLVAGLIWWQRALIIGQPTSTKPPAQPMSTVPATIARGNINVIQDGLGTVTSLATVNVKTQISGQLVQVNFKEGQEVKKGDLLAAIDARPYQAALDQAKGTQARDEALLKGSKVDLVRYQGLAAQNAVMRQTLDTQVALVAQYEGTVEADKAAVEAANVNLIYCNILAPVDGLAGLRQVDQGNYVTPADTTDIVVITQFDPISVLFTVPEDQLQTILARLKSGAVLTTTALDRSSSNKLAEGELQSHDSQIDPTTGTIKLRSIFTNKDRKLYPNQFVNVELLVEEHKNVLLLPSAAVQRGVPGTFVYLINSDSSVSVRKIVLGVTEGEHVEVLSGLEVGDRVVVDGADKLRDGAKVIVREENQNAAPAQPAPQSAPKPPATTPATKTPETQTPDTTPPAPAGAPAQTPAPQSGQSQNSKQPSGTKQ